MANNKNLNLAACLAGLLFYLPFAGAQNEPLPPAPEEYSATPSHMWEIGLHGGTALTFGDIDFQPNWGAGFHVRRAIDYVFSLRGEALYASLKNDDREDGTTETNFQSASLQMLISLNNLNWTPNENRKTNIYALAGAGVNRFKMEVIDALDPTLVSMEEGEIQTHADVGVGIAFRLSPSFNIGFETKATTLFGNNNDRIDGIVRRNRDIISYSSVRLNFNIGNREKKAEPLYWVNPMDIIMDDITELKARPIFDIADTDGDGVIDMIDQDPNSPAGAPVDTRGIPLDSDGDGIPNYQDEEPYIPVGKTYATTEEVKVIIGGEMQEYEATKGGIAEWFLPSIHFNIDKATIRYADYGHMASIAKVMKNNPDMRVTVIGYTDKTASEDYNMKLSYKRAKAAVDHLVNIHGIARSRLVLQYNGENDILVPLTGSTVMNRRVEFRVAKEDDVDMDKPVPTSGKHKRRGF